MFFNKQIFQQNTLSREVNKAVNIGSAKLISIIKEPCEPW